MEFVSPALQNRTGISWINQHGYVGINAFGEEIAVLDGLNETGLACSGLWYEKDTLYQDIDAYESDQALAHLLLGSWILGNYVTCNT